MGVAIIPVVGLMVPMPAVADHSHFSNNRAIAMPPRARRAVFNVSRPAVVDVSAMDVAAAHADADGSAERIAPASEGGSRGNSECSRRCEHAQ